MYKCSKQRLYERIKIFSRFGETPTGGITRLSLSRADLTARNEFCKRCAALGMYISMDDMANIYATIPGDPSLPSIMIGSHIDSVRSGGNYDGVLGVLGALEAAETIVAQNIQHRHPITVVVWTNAEGSRFQPTMMASGVISGKLDKSQALYSVSTDPEDSGITFGEALEESGFKGEEYNRATGENCIAFIELHVEQGPILDRDGVDIGVVQGVCDMVDFEFTIKGQADHAGTTPMRYRRDALFAATKTIQYLHDEFDKLDPNLVYTIGKISCHPNVYSSIPDLVKFTLDARHRDPTIVESVLDIVNSIPAETEKCKVGIKETCRRGGVQFYKPYVDIVEACADELGYSHRSIYSGPGHDAQYISEIIPTAMILVPSEGGYSHCEREHTSMDSCIKGVNVLLNMILKLDAML